MPDPAELRLGVGIGLPMLAVTPGPAGALLMVPLTARQADHASIVARHRISLAAADAGGCDGLRACAARGRVGAGQAAFARRILRRRSADRSSSFSPPQVPYFSGRLTA